MRRGSRVPTREEAGRAAAALGFPVVVKAEIANLTHKSDVGGVILDVHDVDGAERAADQILANVSERGWHLDGLLVERMAAEGIELVVSCFRDGSFGPVLAVGLGGIHVDLLQDVRFGLAPAGPSEVRTLVESLRAFPLLDGHRGQPRSDLEALYDALVSLSAAFVGSMDVELIEINPLLVHPGSGGVTAVDAVAVRRRPPNEESQEDIDA